MTRNLEDDLGDPDRSPRAGLLARLAHLFPYALTLWVVYTIASAAGVLPSLLWVPALAILLVMAVGDLHGYYGRICLRCMESLPVDAGQRVAQWRWLLWFQHRVMRRRWGYFIGWFGLVFVEVAFRFALGFGTGEAHWTGAPLNVWVGVSIWSGWKHHRYQPWCPYCRWDDGGDREPSPDPDTSGVKTG